MVKSETPVRFIFSMAIVVLLWRRKTIGDWEFSVFIVMFCFSGVGQIDFYNRQVAEEVESPRVPDEMGL